jgi:hypothetical protein
MLLNSVAVGEMLPLLPLLPLQTASISLTRLLYLSTNASAMQVSHSPFDSAAVGFN